jgi:hypothetical protein
VNWPSAKKDKFISCITDQPSFVNMTNPLERLRIWYGNYVDGSLDQDQPKFWLLFWGSFAISCAGFYLYKVKVQDYLDLPIQGFSNDLMAIICTAFSSLVLRRLTYLAIAAALVFGVFYVKNYLLDLLFHGEHETGRFVIDILIYCLIGLLIRKLYLSTPPSSE